MHSRDLDRAMAAESDADRCVFVSGLPYSCTEEDVRAFFKECGTIESLRMPKSGHMRHCLPARRWLIRCWLCGRWHDSGRCRGYAHVTFEEDEAAQHALELNGENMGDRCVRACFAHCSVLQLTLTVPVQICGGFPGASAAVYVQ